MKENLMISLNAILPLLLCMAFGYLAARFHWGDEAFFRKCNSFCFKAFLPMMMFVNIVDADIASVFQPKLILFAVVSVCVFTLAEFFVVRRIASDDSRRAVLSQAIFRSNYIIFGVSVAANLYGEGQIAEAALMAAVAVPLVNVLSVVILEYYSPNKTSPLDILKGVLKNPIILGAVAAILVKLLPFTLPTAVSKAIGDLAKIATPLSLVMLGATFRFDAVGKNLKYIVVGVVGKLIVYPLIMMPIAILLGFREVALLSLMILWAGPTAVSSYTMAENAGFDGQLAGQLVVFTSLFSIVTMFVWIFLLKTMQML